MVFPDGSDKAKRSFTMSKRREYEDQVRAKLEELEREIDLLKAKVKVAEAELAPEHHDKIDKLHELKEEAREKLHELIEAADDAWEDLQDGVEHYWSALGNEVKAFDNYFKK
jgi:chromosome segregation ATPase